MIMANTAEAYAAIRYGIFEQATWGTGAVDGSAIDELVVEHAQIDDDLQVRESISQTGVRFKLNDNVKVDVAGAMPKVSGLTFPEANADTMDLLCYAWFQKVTEGAASPYGKTFVLPVSGTTQQPDFSASAGFFCSFVKRMPTASQSLSVDDCVAEALTIKAEPSGMVNATVDLVGRGSVNKTLNPSGTWTLNTANGWHYTDILTHTIDFGSGAVSVPLMGAWEVGLTQKVSAVDPESGSHNSIALTERGGSFTIRTQKDANSQTAFANAVAGTAITAVLGWSNSATGTAGDTDDDLQITVNGVITDAISIEGEDVTSVVLTGQITSDDNTGSPVTIVVANDTDRTW